jgi:hypothetical protein
MQDGKQRGNITMSECLVEWNSSGNSIHPDGHHACTLFKAHRTLHECSCGRFLQNTINRDKIHNSHEV